MSFLRGKSQFRFEYINQIKKSHGIVFTQNSTTWFIYEWGNSVKSTHLKLKRWVHVKNQMIL